MSDEKIEAMTAERLAEIRARAEAAPAGPWFVEALSRESLNPAILAGADEIGATGFDSMVASIVGRTSDIAATASFVAHARMDVPALLAALEAAQAPDAIVKANAQRDLALDALVKAEKERDAARALAKETGRQLGEVGAERLKAESERDVAPKERDEAQAELKGERALRQALQERLDREMESWAKALEEARGELAKVEGERDEERGQADDAREARDEAEMKLAASEENAEANLKLAQQRENERDEARARVAALEQACDIFEKNSADATAVWEQNRTLTARVAELEGALVTARVNELEEAERIVEADLLDQPGVIVAAERRFDGGSSERAVRRIAEKLFRRRSHLVLAAVPPEQAPAQVVYGIGGRAECATCTERGDCRIPRGVEAHPCPSRIPEQAPASPAVEDAVTFAAVFEAKNRAILAALERLPTLTRGEEVGEDLAEALDFVRARLEEALPLNEEQALYRVAPRTDAWAQPSVQGLVDALLDIRGWSAPRTPPNWATTPIPCEDLRARIYERTWAALPGEPSVLCSVAPRTDDGALRERMTRLETVLRVGAELAAARADDAEPASHDLAGRMGGEWLLSWSRMLTAWAVGAKELLDEVPTQRPADVGAAPPASTGTASDLARQGDAAIEEAQKLAQAGDPLCARELYLGEVCGHVEADHEDGCRRCTCPGFVAPGEVKP